MELTGHRVPGEHDDAALEARFGVVVCLDTVAAAIVLDDGARDWLIPRHAGRVRALCTPNTIAVQ